MAPRTGSLAFASQDAYTARPDGSGLELIARAPTTENAIWSFVNVDWAPTETAIAADYPTYCNYPNDNCFSWHLLRIGLDGSEASLGLGHHPAWSSSRNLVAFEADVEADQSNHMNPHAVAVVDPRTKRTWALMRGGEKVTFHRPVWSPDGRLLAFTVIRGYAAWVYVASGPHLRKVRKLTRGIYPSWRPGGKALAVSRPSGIWIVALKGARGHRVFDCFSANLTLCRGTSWSPDGTRVAWEGGSSATAGIRVTVLRTGRTRLVVATGETGYRAPEYDDFFKWSRDARSLYFVSVCY